ncbi:MAG: BatA domain-containing protein [Planctomycetota bacterium]
MFGQFFANPAMLLGAAAIVAPITLFLLNRFRYRTIDWAALTFLERAFKQQKRRLQLENLLLLLIRCLILILLAVAMAHPVSRSGVAVNEEAASRNVLLLLDTSYSTGYQVGSTEDDTVRARARRAAKEIVSALKEGDRVNVIAFDETVRPLYPQPKLINDQAGRDAVLADLDEAHELAESQRGTHLGDALRELPQALRPFDFVGGKPPNEGTKPLKKTVFLLGDAQRLGLLDAKGQLQDRSLLATSEEIKQLGAAILLVDCGAEDPRNVSVVRLATREPVVGKDLPAHIEATLRNATAHELKDLSVEYYVDGAETPQKTVSVTLGPEGEVTPDPLRYIFKNAGLHRVEVRVKSDPLVLDNARHLVVDVREEVRALLVDGERSPKKWESETDFLRAALKISEHVEEGAGSQERGLIRPEVVDEAGLAAHELRGYDVVVVANVVQLADDVVSKLERYAREGGTVVFTMGGLVNKDAWNDALWRNGRGILPAKLLEKRGGTKADASSDESAPEWVLTLGDCEGHSVQMFQDKEMGSWMRATSVFGFYTVQLEPQEKPEGWVPPWTPMLVVPRSSTDDVPAAAAAGAGQPILVERPYGRGRSVLWLSSVDDDWNNAVVYDVFYVPFWRELVLDLSQRARPAANLRIGDRYERHFTAEQYAARVEVETPGERHEGVPLEKVQSQELYRLAYPVADERGGLQESGLYTLRRSGVAAGPDPAPDYFAVRVDPSEGDLAKFSAEELGEALGLEVKQVRPDAARDALVSDAGSAGNREYWREVVVALLALLVLESTLAALFGRRRN